jgi:hypothetical protein
MTTKERMTRNAIRIVNWRRHSDDESHLQMGVFAAGDPGDVHLEIEDKIDPEYDWKQDAERAEDWERVYYVIDDVVIADADVIEHNGRRFRVSITEVEETSAASAPGAEGL